VFRHHYSYSNRGFVMTVPFGLGVMAALALFTDDAYRELTSIQN
jgi:hypothetical protein